MSEYKQTKQSKKSKSNFEKQTTPTRQTNTSNPISIIQRAIINPKSLTHDSVMQFQHIIRNRTVGRLLSSIGMIPFTAQKVSVWHEEIPEDEESLQGKMKGQILVPLRSELY